MLTKKTLIGIFLWGAACTPSRPPSPEEREIANPPPESTGLRVVREFTCVPPTSKADDVLFALEGRPDHSVAIRPANADCQFELILKQPAGDVILSQRAGGYLLGVSAPRAICLANIVHGLDTTAPNVTIGDKAHRMQRVDLECAVEWADNQWTALQRVVEGGADFAAWPSFINFDDTSKAWKAGWVRDFSFQFLNISERGRPSSDGLYETSFTLSQDRLSVGETQKMADAVASESIVELGGTP